MLFGILFVIFSIIHPKLILHLTLQFSFHNSINSSNFALTIESQFFFMMRCFFWASNCRSIVNENFWSAQGIWCRCFWDLQSNGVFRLTVPIPAHLLHNSNHYNNSSNCYNHDYLEDCDNDSTHDNRGPSTLLCSRMRRWGLDSVFWLLLLWIHSLWLVM